MNITKRSQTTFMIWSWKIFEAKYETNDECLQRRDLEKYLLKHKLDELIPREVAEQPHAPC